MSDTFDPYHQWMGIPPAEQPPNYYRLLGVPLFESDPDVIDNAAKQRIRHIQAFQIGAHSDESLRILNEISIARVCLLYAATKAEYDTGLRTAMAVPPVTAPSQPPRPAELPVASLVAPAVKLGRERTLGRWTRRRSRKSPLYESLKIVLGGVAGIAFAYCLLLFVFRIDILGRLSSPMPPEQVGLARRTSESHEDLTETGIQNEATQQAESKSTPYKPIEAKPLPIDSSVTPRAFPSSPERAQRNLRVTETPEEAEKRLKAEAVEAPSDAEHHPRERVPDGTALEAARKAAAEIYASQFRQAKTVADKTALATEMIDASLTLPNGSADQYILLKIGRDMAAEAGDATTAIRAAEELAQRFDVLHARVKAESLLTAASRATMSTQHKAIAELAMTVVMELTVAGEYSIAIELCEAAQSSAQRAKQLVMARELGAKRDELQDEWKAVQRYQDALAVLNNDPLEPAANLAAGRHLCFMKGDWEGAVLHLALGSDPELKAAAEMELNGANAAEELAAIGDAWWALAENQQGKERDTLRLRARFWYLQAEPKLEPGLRRLKITERLAETAKLGREHSTSPPETQASGRPPLAVAPFDARTAKERQVAWAKHLNVPVLQTNSIGMRLAVIPAGEFEMGSAQEPLAGKPSETPKHRVRITRPYLLSVCEVTQGEYWRVMESNPSVFKPKANNIIRPADLYRPVENVSWDAAVDFCRRLSELPKEKEHGTLYRLPTEAEWEYACRAGTTTIFSFGDHDGLLEQYAWCRANSGNTTHPVGQKKENAFGLYDMHGNVWEWCGDWQAPYSPDLNSDPRGPDNGLERILRGGCYVLEGGSHRSAARNDEPPLYSSGNLGFRIACDVSAAGEAETSNVRRERPPLPHPEPAMATDRGNQLAGASEFARREIARVVFEEFRDVVKDVLRATLDSFEGKPYASGGYGSYDWSNLTFTCVESLSVRNFPETQTKVAISATVAGNVVVVRIEIDRVLRQIAQATVAPPRDWSALRRSLQPEIVRIINERVRPKLPRDGGR